MAIPRADGTIPARVKVLEDKVRRIQLMPSVSQAAVQPLAVVKSSVWYDSSAGNEPSYFDGQTWVPVRDETIAVAQGTADVAQTTAVTAAADAAQAAADAAAAQAATVALQTDLDAAEAAVAATQADVDTLTGTTLPALQTDLDTAEASITTLTGTTIPGLVADIATAQGDVDAILPITTTDISDDAITTPKIAAGQITAVKIAADTITASQIAANAITASELAANAVIAGKIAAGTIVAADIAAGTITATQIAANTITAAKIAAGTITATEIQAGAIITAKLAATAIDGMTITGAKFRTAASGRRVEMGTTPIDSNLTFYSGAAGEVTPGELRVFSDRLQMISPDQGVGQSALLLYSNTLGHAQASVSADVVDIQGDGNGTGNGRITLGNGGGPDGNGVMVRTNGDGEFKYNDDFVAISGPYWYGYLAAAVNIAATTSVVINWTAESVSPSLGVTHSSGIFAVPRAGRYRITAQGWWTADAETGNRLIQLRTGTSGGSTLASAVEMPSTTLDSQTYFSKTVRLAASGQFRVEASHSTATGSVSLNGNATGNLSYVQVEWVGP